MRYLQREQEAVFVYSGETPGVPVLPEGYQWCLLDQALITRFFARDPEDLWRLRSYNALLERSCIGHILHVGEEWAAVQWLATPQSGGPLHLPVGATKNRYWCFNEHTREQHRRKGLWRTLKDHGVRQVRQDSGDPLTVLFSDTDIENTTARRAHESYGFAHAGVIERVTLRVPRLITFSWGRWESESPHP